MIIEYDSQDGWTGAPSLSGIPSQFVLICPECGGQVSHLQPEIYEPEQEFITPGEWFKDGPVLTGWITLPCQHRVSTREYELFFNLEIMEFRPVNHEH